jgi:IPT/TIG domain-containing protein
MQSRDFFPPALPRQLPPLQATRVWTDRSVTVYVLALALLLIAFAELARAGGPHYIAGTSYFETGRAGQPITWANGTVRYYTDQGRLSSILAGPDADAFVADAFSRWTAIPTAAVSATRAGQLDEDVNGSNVIFNADRSITMPIDIQPSATSKPVAVVYDADGQVTDALMGTGASNDCLTNAAFGGADAFATDGHLAHALVVLDGKCAASANSLPDLKYHLVRALGQVLGLGWSQLNLDAISNLSPPTADDIAGLPVMHERDVSNCLPITTCRANADQPKMDDRAALSRLYPVTSDNVGQFPGKQVFGTNTGRIHGSVYFTDPGGNPAQPMQGVNVVARRIEAGQPSTRYAAASVSGFLFSGNAGNAITGPSDALGQPYSQFGSPASTLEGFFDLAGLELSGGDSAQYQLSVESLDPLLAPNLGPYAPWQVLPSGTATAIIVTVTRGGDVKQDVLMSGSAVDIPEATAPGTFNSPRELPKTGSWMGQLSGYGDADYFSLPGHANRTLSVEVIATDESGNSSTQKAQPVIGMWSLAAPEGATPPAFTPSSFNVAAVGMTQLDAELLESTQFRIGIADIRGDGRPDFRYRARVLYGDGVIPDRVSARGGMPILIEGLGFRAGMTLTLGSIPLTLLAVSATELVATVPALPDGVQTLHITDPSSGGSSTLASALTLGAGPNDMLRLTQGTNSATAVGAEAGYPIRVTVTNSDGSLPVGGATVQWNSTNHAGLSVCNGAATCSVFTDESGQSETRITVGATGLATITASLAPASYMPPKFVQTSVSGVSSSKDLALFSPKVYVAQGATLTVPFTARLLGNGAPLGGQTLNWKVGIGTGTMSPASIVTDGDGYGRSTLRLTNLAGDVQGTVCLAPSNNPCQTFYVVPVASSVIKLQAVAGSLQTIVVGQSFQPIWVRAINSATPPNPVMGVSVTFQNMIFMPDADAPVEVSGDEQFATRHESLAGNVAEHIGYRRQRTGELGTVNRRLLAASGDRD